MTWWTTRQRQLALPGRRACLGTATGCAVLALLIASPTGWPVADAQPAATPATKVAPGGPPGLPTPGAPVLPRGAAGRAASAGPGAVLAWGDNTHGELGDATNLASSTALAVQGLSGVTALAAGPYAEHALTVRRDGSLVSWGRNGHGELGDGTTTSRNVPVAVLNLPPPGDSVTGVAAGYFHSLALTASGAVYAWGDNSYGELGDSTTTSHPTPMPVKNPGNTGNLAGIVAIAAGYGHSLAVAANGSVYAWGLNGDGQLGDGTTGTNRTLPVEVGAGAFGLGACSPAAGCAVAAGNYHSLARAADGRVFGWGNNLAGQVGDGTTTSPKTSPVAVLPVAGPGQLTARTIATGGFHSLAVANDGSAMAWGLNDFGQVGDGSTTNRIRPVAATRAADSAPLTGIAAVAGGLRHSLALSAAGTVLAWGYNARGQLGDGSTTDRSRAAPVLNVAGATEISAGSLHSLALGPDFPLATVTPQPTATQVTFPTPLPTPTPYLYQPPPTSAGSFYLISPVRVVDTRASAPGIVHTGFDQTGAPVPIAPLTPGLVQRFLIAGQTFAGFAFPAGIRGVQLNITAVPTAGYGGFLTVFPGHIPDAARPLTSTLNPVAPINYNLIPLALPTAGQASPGSFAAYTQTVPLDLIVDVFGYYQ